MNRHDEYKNLLNTLEDVPARMTSLSPKTKPRVRRHKCIKAVTAPISVFVAVFLCITVMVNISPTVAHALERVPILNQIAAAVNFSPSLSAAIEHEFIQYIGMQQTMGDVTVRVEYIIVDQRELNVFYTLHSSVWPNVREWRPSFLNADGTHTQAVVFSGSLSDHQDDVRRVTLNFFDIDMPGHLIFMLEVLYSKDDSNVAVQAMPAPIPAPRQDHAWVPDDQENIITFIFELEFDPLFTEKAERVVLHYDFIMDGQRLTLTYVDIYPTSMRIHLEADAGNTAWLQSIAFYAIDEQGRRFDSITNGITAFGQYGTRMMQTHVLNSPFFAQSEALTLVITEVTWLDKEMERVRVDLVSAEAESLPEGVAIDFMRFDGDSWHLSFAVQARAENHSHSVFRQDFYNEAGDSFTFNAWSSSTRFFDEDGNLQNTWGEHANEGIFYLQFNLHHFPYDIVYLSPSYSRVVCLTDAVYIKIK